MGGKGWVGNGQQREILFGICGIGIADGPDEVHLGTLAWLELAKVAPGGSKGLKALRSKM